MKRLALALGAVGVITGLAACGSSGSGGGSNGAVVLGSSYPATGPLAAFAPLIKSGYEQAVNEVNAAGGLQVGDSKRKVKLELLDNKSDPNLASQQERTLVNDRGAVGLLGSATPQLNIPSAAAAEALRIPFVTSITPVGPWAAGNTSGWHYAWNFFFDPVAAVQAEFTVADMTDTNKNVALFVSNEADGKAWAQIVGQLAPKVGYKVVASSTFPVGSTNFRSAITNARGKGADVVIAQLPPPDGIALWKQMKGLNYTPKVAFCEKCGDAGAFSDALGGVAEGASTAGFWTSQAGLPRTDEMKATLGKKFDNDPDLSLAIASLTAAHVLMDAISKAGTTDPAKVNEAIKATDKTYPFAKIKFGKDNAATTPSLMQQWRKGTTVQVLPPANGVKLAAPVAGL
jgi:branched-chain amino acid transport system substrate-binding protein